MKTFTKSLALAFLALGITAPAMAQETDSKWADRKVFPRMFVGVQGGVQNTLDTDFDNKKTFTPTAALSLGSYFSPVVGARLNFNGAWNKGTALSTFSADQTAHYNFNYLTTSADLLVNLCTSFGKKDYYPANLYFIMGLGLYHSWNNDDAVSLAAQKYRLIDVNESKRNAFNGRLGLQFAYDVCRDLAVNVEGSYNLHAGQTNTFDKSNDQFVLLAGLAYKFGGKKAAPAREEYETRIDTIWYNEAQVTPRVEDGKMSWNVFYEIRESDFSDTDAQLAKIGAFLKDYRDCKITVKSYADVQTGNPRINMQYSKARNEKAVKALVDAGVQRSIIDATYYGDTVQPFAQNDKNRVTIITATGLKDVKDTRTVRKFRTEEKQVRVK
ncbi:MAG TPA: hypothetical protein DC006_00785 [Prevotellaceae bacterium]|nr:hypothetical protein [Prevotellaceae bacterium]